MNTLNLAQKGHFEVTFARSSVKTGSPVCKTPLLQVVIAHNLLNYVHIELFGDYLYSKCQQVVNKWSEKWSKRGVLLGVTDSIPIPEYNCYHE